MVIGPTPPGTGVIRPATCDASSKATSPMLPGLYPASTTTAPGLSHEPRTKHGLPTAAMTMSAPPIRSGRLVVREWQ